MNVGRTDGTKLGQSQPEILFARCPHLFFQGSEAFFCKLREKIFFAE